MSWKTMVNLRETCNLFAVRLSLCQSYNAFSSIVICASEICAFKICGLLLLQGLLQVLETLPSVSRYPKK